MDLAIVRRRRRWRGAASGFGNTLLPEEQKDDDDGVVGTWIKMMRSTLKEKMDVCAPSTLLTTSTVSKISHPPPPKAYSSHSTPTRHPTPTWSTVVKSWRTLNSLVNPKKDKVRLRLRFRARMDCGFVVRIWDMDFTRMINGVALPWVNKDDSSEEKNELLELPAPDLAKLSSERNDSFFRRCKHILTYRIPVAICKVLVTKFLNAAITKGELVLKLNDGSQLSFGDKSKVGDNAHPVTARVFDDWFFVKVATEYDLALARSYMTGQFLVEALDKREEYPWTLRPPAGATTEANETDDIIGDPISLTRLFLLFVGNPDTGAIGVRSSKQHTYSNALQNASGLGLFVNYLRFKIFMDNSERGGSLKNIHAHYDLSNDLFRTFLDKETLMYSSAIYDAVAAPPGKMGQHSEGLVFKGSLEEAQWRKLDILCDRAQIQLGQTLLDIGFGWGGPPSMRPRSTDAVSLVSP